MRLGPEMYRRQQRALALYNAAFPPCFLAMLPSALQRLARRGGYSRGFGARFGRFDRPLADWCRSRGPVWLASVSVGETRLALRIMDALRKQHPTLPILISTTTTTAAALALERVDAHTAFCYNPLDFTPTLRPAFDAIQPRALLGVEAFWPNLFNHAKTRSIASVWLPRISPRSRKRYEYLGATAGALFALADRITPGFPSEVGWLENVGVPPDRIRLTGSVKFDVAHQPAEPNASFPALLRGMQWQLEQDLVVIAGSTFPGEERLIAEACRKAFSDRTWRLIVVPRHVERRGEILRDLREAGFTVGLRSASAPTPADVLLVDTTGELTAWYACAEIAVVGKSFLDHRGGQNPIEPCLAGCQVITGASMENFTDISQSLDQAGLLDQTRADAELVPSLIKAARNGSDRRNIQTATRTIIEPHQGAADRVADLLLASVVPGL